MQLVNLFDKRGITNRDPIPYKIKLIIDQYPQLYIKEPKENIELGSDQTLLIDLELQDDFGFNSLQIGYQVNRPKYLNIEPFISMKKISDLRLDSLIQTIQTYWELTDLNLMPEGDDSMDNATKSQKFEDMAMKILKDNKRILSICKKK